ncbi:MAG: PH domain-containing protein [Candidatus Dormibacteria bacterium]
MLGSVNSKLSPVDTWLHPSPRLGAMRRVELGAVCAVAVLLLVVTAIIGAITGSRSVPPATGVSLVVVIVLGLAADTFLQRRVRAWAYCERADDLLVQRGVLVSRLSVVPYGRMQFIDVVAGPVERAFGLATVRMHTAAAASDARIPGLTRDDAARLRDNLAQLGEARAAGL